MKKGLDFTNDEKEFAYVIKKLAASFPRILEVNDYVE